MFLLSRPSDDDIAAFVQRSTEDRLSYDDVGASLSSPPEGYIIDHNRMFLGHGPETFELGKQAMREWKMFDLGWVELHHPGTPIEVGRNVAVLVSHLGFYSLNAARIVYLIDEPGRFGFAYGTLTDHGESGEERFSIEFDAETGEVWYDLFAFSRPGHVLSQVGYPFARHFQRRFAHDSKIAMLQAVKNAGERTQY